MKPTIGRIVHYMDSQGTVVPGMITVVYPDGAINITAFYPNKEDYIKNRYMAAGPREAEPGQWWWPERI